MDTLANMLTSIRNAQAVKHKTVKIPFSNVKYNLAKILEKEGFIESTEKKGSKQKPVIIIDLKYNEAQKPAIKALERVSRPGQRIYVGYKDIMSVRGGYGKAVISTPNGLRTGEDAKKQKLGGEYICKVW